MSTQHRQKRLPISCEPCRVRKIRCNQPRGPPPCAACVRRGLASRCQYADRHQTMSPTPQYVPLSPASERSGLDTAASLSNKDLAARVANLEALVQAQATGTQASPGRLITPCAKVRGVLSTSDLGHVRFIPSSKFPGSSGSLSDPQQTTCRSIDLSDGPYPLGKKQTNLTCLLNDLPPRHHCKQLKDVYFESFAPLFHILHDPTFSEQYAEFEKNPEAMPLSWLALLFAILGTSVVALGASNELLDDLSRKNSVTDQVAELSERYRNAAFKCLEADNYLWQQNVTTLQALVILIYSINHSHGQTWTLLGMTFHIALSLGCHIDPSEFGLDVVRSEERRRCWAGIMMLYMIQNMSMGHLGPDPWNASEGVRMPSDLNDSDLVAGEYVSLVVPSRATQMSYLLLKFRLYHISNEISSVVRNSLQPPPTLVERLDERIVSEQRSWHDKYTADSTAASLPTYHEVHLHILQGYSHQLMLLLHNHSMRTSMAGTSQRRLSVAKALSSAKEILQIHAVFFTRSDFSPFGWYLRGICSFHAYHAAVSLIAIIAEHTWNDAFEDIIPLVQDCVVRFEALTEVSIICNKAVPVLQSMLQTIQTWTIYTGSQRQLGSLQTQDRHPRSQQPTSTELGHVSGWSLDGNELSEAFQPVQNMMASVIEEFDPQAWLTPFGNW